MLSHIRVILLVVIFMIAGCLPTKQVPSPGTRGSRDEVTQLSTTDSDQENIFSTPTSTDAIDPVEILPDQELLSDPETITPADQDVLDTQLSFEVSLDIDEHKDVQRYFHEYAHKHRRTMENWLKRAQLYLPHIRERFQAEGLPEDLMYLPFAESGFNPFALSRAGASGLWQFMPQTGVNMGLTVNSWVDERRDPYASTEAAIKYLKKLYAMFDDWSLALAAYNAGEGTIGRALQKTGCTDYFALCDQSNQLALETKLYVPKFLALAKIARNLETLGFEPINWDTRPASLVKLQAKPGTDLLALANNLGMDWKTFRDMNPMLRKQEAAPKKGVSIAVPGHLVAQAQEFLQRPIMVAKQNTSGGYKVRSGDSWWSIAKKHGLSVAKLQEANQAGKNQILQAGKVLTIPGAKGNSPEETRKWAERRANYIVRPGDSIWSIAQEFKTDPATLLQANGLTTKSTLKIGQKLFIADAGSVQTKQVRARAEAARDKLVNYRVRPGDSLWAIAKRFNVSVDQLLTWNKLAKNAAIRPGDQLTLYP